MQAAIVIIDIFANQRDINFTRTDFPVFQTYTCGSIGTLRFPVKHLDFNFRRTVFTHPEISLWRKGQETFGGNVHIGELHIVLATGVIAKPAGRVLLTNVTIHHHNGINPFAVFVVDTLF